MNVLKHPSFFRPANHSSPSPPLTNPPPASRPSSSTGFERAARPLNKLSLNGFRRSSPSPIVSMNNIPTTLVQDGSYLELLNLKLSEAVSRALAQPSGPAAANEQLLGKRPIPAGRGHALGSFIASELKATQDSPHLHRAIIRSLHRPLSVLLTNLSAHLLPLISSPAFHAPPPSVQSPNPNSTQLHAIAIATFVGELLETFDEFELGTDLDVRGDGLKSIREGLVSLINRVVGPMINAIRHELMPVLEALETQSYQQGTKAAPNTKGLPAHHPSIHVLQATMPVYAKAITRITTSAVSQTTLATFLISIVWRGLVALAHRPLVPTSPPTSPGLAPVALKKSRGATTPPLTPPPARFNIKLPPSRPPSPTHIIQPSAAADARALFDLLNLLPRPVGSKESARLAREVVDDAFEGLQALPDLLDAVHAVPAKISSEERLDQVARELDILATKVPLLIALPVVLQAPANGTSSVAVSSLIGLSVAQYRTECLSGFGRAEECAITVAHRVQDVLSKNTDVHPVVSKWLDIEILETSE
ncbi:hypothetical protein C0993_006689 [Termitomyces sp. T159_Od127]|nr:hypothetical protein C0993_006689 [Termitomyces sp. T159_Od127]